MQLDEHAAVVASRGERLAGGSAAPVGRGGIGEVIDAAVRRGIRIVAGDVGAAVRRFYTEAGEVLRRAAAETERTDGEARQAFDALGHRRSPFFDLSPDEIEEVRQEFQEIGGDPMALRFNLGARTGYVDGDHQIRVCGDVFPSGPPDPRRPNATMTSRAALAHELGHRHFDVPEGHPDYLPPRSPEDEMRASAWAAEHVPGLTDEERRFLLLDARRRRDG